MIKALLIVWLGVGYSQTLDIEKFDSMTECEAALAALNAEFMRIRASDYIKCIPYEVNK